MHFLGKYALQERISVFSVFCKVFCKDFHKYEGSNGCLFELLFDIVDGQAIEDTNQAKVATAMDADKVKKPSTTRADIIRVWKKISAKIAQKCVKEIMDKSWKIIRQIG